jgi:hypothetical protein
VKLSVFTAVHKRQAQGLGGKGPPASWRFLGLLAAKSWRSSTAASASAEPVRGLHWFGVRDGVGHIAASRVTLTVTLCVTLCVTLHKRYSGLDVPYNQQFRREHCLSKAAERAVLGWFGVSRDSREFAPRWKSLHFFASCSHNFRIRSNEIIVKLSELRP